MHRLIMGLDAGDPREVDHVNCLGTDNQRSNLRICTHAQNIQNARNVKNTSGYRGVGKNNGRWAAYIGVNGKQTTIGRFGTKKEAARAYNEAAKKYHGEFAVLNPV